MSTILNFSGGPGALPAVVLEQASQAVLALPETGVSVLGMSHRSDWFRAVLDEAESNLRGLLHIPPGYHLLFLQGGSSLQFCMLPMNYLRHSGRVAEYLLTGYWSRKASLEASLEGSVRIPWQGGAHGYRRLPAPQELELAADAAYLHYVSNETVEGLQFSYVPGLPGVPLVCDMSSDILAAPMEVGRYAFIYAHAQKNLGPAGVTIVIMSEDFPAPAPALPSMLDYRTHIEARSLYNTPPVFAIYVLLLVTRWLRREIGGLEAMAAINRAKARLIYEALEAAPGFYLPRSAPGSRSLMNVAFSLPSAQQEAHFLAAALEGGFLGLQGHRSIGGMRVSLYNGVSLPAATSLAAWLRDYAQRHG